MLINEIKSNLFKLYLIRLNQILSNFLQFLPNAIGC